MAKLDSKIPKGSLSEKWTNHKSDINLVSPANKRLIDIIVVGTGLAGASASATLANWVIMLKHFVFKILPEEHILSPHREELMLPKTIKVVVILLTDFFMIPSRVVITDPENLMSTV